MYYRRTIYGDVGGFVKKLFLLLFVYFGFKYYGTSIANDLCLAIFDIVAYILTGWFLRAIGFWWY